MTRASYRHGVRWIAENDEPEGTDLDEVSGYISTLLLADLFGKDADIVAADIIKHREKAGTP